MKKGILCAVLVLTLSLTACGTQSATTVTTFDIFTYVDGLMKENYLGVYEPNYLEMVEITGEEAERVYEAGLDAEVERFLYAYDIRYPTDTFRKELKQLFREIYAHTRYRIVSIARQQDASYAVRMEVEPINVVQAAEGAWDKTVKGFFDQYPVEVLNTMSEENFQKADQEWAELILELYRDKLNEVGHQPAQTITVQVEPDRDGFYTINSSDFARVDELVLNWTGGGEKL